MKKIFGYELLVDAYKCKESINDLEHCYHFLEDAVRVLGVQKQSPPFVFHSPEEFTDKTGISGWVPLIESGIQIHTLDKTGFVSVDYYTCSTIDDKVKQKLVDLIKEYFSPGVVDVQLIERGVDYYS